MFRFLVDRLPKYRNGDVVSGDSDSNVLADRNPANPYSWTAASQNLTILLQAYDSAEVPANCIEFPVNCVALFGISKSLLGAEVEIRRNYPTSGYPATAEYKAVIGGDRLWIPFDDVCHDDVDNLVTNVADIQVRVVAAATGTYSLGELVCGLTETLRFNFVYGANYGQAVNNTVIPTRGGVDFVYNENAVSRAALSFEWSQTLNDQDLALLYRLYDDTGGGLFPFVVIPEDTVRSGPRSCFYGRLPQEFARINNFLRRNTHQLEFREAIAYEEPEDVSA